MTSDATTHPPRGLYQPRFERDSCGFGLIAQMDDRPSHWLVRTAVDALARLTHRGAVAADGKTGDGCGLLLKKPNGFLESLAARAGHHARRRSIAVGMLFLNARTGLHERAREIITEELSAEGLQVAGWREVPTDPFRVRQPGTGDACRTSSRCSSTRPQACPPTSSSGGFSSPAAAPRSE